MRSSRRVDVRSEWIFPESSQTQASGRGRPCDGLELITNSSSPHTLPRNALARAAWRDDQTVITAHSSPHQFVAHTAQLSRLQIRLTRARKGSTLNAEHSPALWPSYKGAMTPIAIKDANSGVAVSGPMMNFKLRHHRSDTFVT